MQEPVILPLHDFIMILYVHLPAKNPHRPKLE